MSNERGGKGEGGERSDGTRDGEEVVGGREMIDFREVIDGSTAMEATESSSAVIALPCSVLTLDDGVEQMEILTVSRETVRSGWFRQASGGCETACRSGTRAPTASLSPARRSLLLRWLGLRVFGVLRRRG